MLLFGMASHKAYSISSSNSIEGLCSVSTSDCTPKVEVDFRSSSNFCPEPECVIRCNTGCYPCGTTTYIPRSQGDNIAREMCEWDRSIFKYAPDENYTSIALAVEYTQTFDECAIARKLFCTDCLTFTGSQVPNRNGNSELLADNFGLPTYFKGTLKIKPKISNYIIDVQAFWGLHEWLPGLFIRLNAPIVHTKWDLGLNECLVCDNLTSATAFSPNNLEYPPCYIAPGASTVNEEEIPVILYPPQSLRDALSGDVVAGDMRTPWNHGIFSFCPLDKTRIADVDISVGFSVVDTYWSNIALYAKVSMPWGTRPKGKFIFEPMVGNGHHWQLGGGIYGHINLLGDPCCSMETFGIYFEGYITHMFKTHQKRAFDFLDQGFMSRYMLLKEFTRDGVTYANNIINAIDFATRNCDVTVPINGDFAIKASWRSESWQFDLGYNIWGKSAEKVCIKTNCACPLDSRKFGFKGTEGVCALAYSIIDGAIGVAQPSLDVSLNATQFNATAFRGGTTDNPGPVINGTADLYLTALSNQTTGTLLIDPTIQQAQSSYNPILITCNDLDPNSAAQCAFITHKVFGNIGYLWFDSCWEPHLGIGGEVEFNQKCNYTPFRQWGVWLKGGLSY